MRTKDEIARAEQLRLSRARQRKIEREERAYEKAHSVEVRLEEAKIKQAEKERAEQLRLSRARQRKIEREERAYQKARAAEKRRIQKEIKKISPAFIVKDIKKTLKETTGFTGWLLTPFKVLSQLPESIKKDMESLYNHTRPDKGEINIPEWDDIIKLGPEAAVSKDEKKEWKKWRDKFKKLTIGEITYDPSQLHKFEHIVGKLPLTDEQIISTGKRFVRMEKIRKSSIPSTVSQVGQILDWMDTINDGIVTLGYLARTGLRIMSKAAPHAALRGIPYLGQILLAKDLFDVMKWFRAGGAFRAEKQIVGLGEYGTAILEKGKVTIQYSGMAGKRASYNVLKMLPSVSHIEFKGSKIVAKVGGGVYPFLPSFEVTDVLPEPSKHPLAKVVPYKLKRIGTYLPTFSEAIQIAQTTQLVTGYGLSLGGIIGAGLDAVAKAATTSPLKGFERLLHSSTYNDALEKQKIGQHKSPVLTPASVDAMQILNVAPQLMVHAESLSFEDNLMILTAMNHAAAFLRGTGDLNDWEEWSKDTIDLPEQPPIISNDVRDDLVDAGLPDPGREGKYPFMGGVSTITPRLRASLSAPLISEQFNKWLTPAGNDPRVAYALSVISELPENLFKMYEGEGLQMETKLNMDAKAHFLLVEYGLEKKLGTTSDQYIALTTQITDWLIRNQNVNPSYQQLDALIDLHLRLKK